MIRAYDENYLVHSTRALGWMLDSAVNLFGFKAAPFWRLFISTGYADRFGKGESAILAGMTGYELARAVLDAAKAEYVAVPPSEVTDLSPEYWAGWALAHYQWRSALSFSEIDSFAPITEVIACYSPYHEMDISQFCDEMDRLYRVRFPERNLKRIRRIAHLSQSELATRSGVSVRTIQELEQGRKDINRAGIDTLMPLAAALSVNVESLVERVV